MSTETANSREPQPASPHGNEQAPAAFLAAESHRPWPSAAPIPELSHAGHSAHLGIYRQAGAGAARVTIKRALSWLGRRGATISRHVTRHTRVIAGRAVHTVFRSPNQVKKLVIRVLDAPDNVVVQRGRRLRYVIEKQFNREIGRNGETILRVVVERSGRIVTAFPVREFTRAGAAAGVTFVAIEDATAAARNELEALETQAQQALEDAEPSWAEELFWDIVTFGLHGGSLNVGEDVYLWADRRTRQIQEQAVSDVLTAVEEAEAVCLNADERSRIRDLVTVGLAFPDLMGTDESEDAPRSTP